MTAITVPMGLDQTEVPECPPVLEAWRRAPLDVSDVPETAPDEGAPQESESEPAEHDQTSLDRSDDGSTVKRSSFLTGAEAETSPAQAAGHAPGYSTPSELDPEAVLILRSRYLGAILTSLEEMQLHARTTRVARYAGEMLEASFLYADRVPGDPVVEVILAVYPALADENHWADWSAEQLGTLHEILQGLMRRASVTPKVVDKAIIQIEERVSLDTLPFEIDPRQIS